MATLLLIAGTLNIIYGIGALDDANIFKNDQRFVLDNLNTLGWVLIVLGIIQLTGGTSLIAGNTYGRVIAITGGTLGAIGALLSIGGAYPWWSLAIFFLCVYTSTAPFWATTRGRCIASRGRAQAPLAFNRSHDGVVGVVPEARAMS